MPSGLEQSCRSGSGEIRIVLPDPVFVIHPNSPDPPLKLPIPHLPSTNFEINEKDKGGFYYNVTFILCFTYGTVMKN